MPQIIINQSPRKEDDSLKLNNGSIVVLYDEYNTPIRSYLVTSYRGDKNGYYKIRSQYCTLIDLATGYPAFEEPSSRDTTISRLSKHIYEGSISYTDAKPSKYFRYIKVLNKDNYQITITY